MLDEKEQMYMIIDASGFTYIDYTGVESLKNLSNELTTRNATMIVASPKGYSKILTPERGGGITLWPDC